jgi:hypothetical protein
MSEKHKKSIPAPSKKPGNKRLTVIVILSVILAVTIGVVAVLAISNAEDYKQLSAERETVATCYGFDIPYEELRFVTLFYKDEMEGRYGKGIWDDPATAEQYRAELEELVKENLNENYVVLATCKNLGIPTESRDMEGYVNEQLRDLREEFDSKKEYREWLDEHWMTEHYMRFSIGVSYLESAIYYTLLDNDLYQYRHDNIGEFLDYVEYSGEYVRTIHVFIENAEGEDPAANLARAKEMSDTLRAIEDPEERRMKMSEYIGSKYNDDLQSVSGDGYYFTKREMDEDYENASFALAVGEVSEPVVCRGGNFVIMRLPPEEEYIIKNAQNLLNNYHSVCLGIYEDQFRPQCVVEFNEYGKSIDLLTIQ